MCEGLGEDKRPERGGGRQSKTWRTKSRIRQARSRRENIERKVKRMEEKEKRRRKRVDGASIVSGDSNNVSSLEVDVTRYEEMYQYQKG